MEDKSCGLGLQAWEESGCVVRIHFLKSCGLGLQAWEESGCVVRIHFLKKCRQTRPDEG
jgi:hypothetical protein